MVSGWKICRICWLVYLQDHFANQVHGEAKGRCVQREHLPFRGPLVQNLAVSLRLLHHAQHQRSYVLGVESLGKNSPPWSPLCLA